MQGTVSHRYQTIGPIVLPMFLNVRAYVAIYSMLASLLSQVITPLLALRF